MLSFASVTPTPPKGIDLVSSPVESTLEPTISHIDSYALPRSIVLAGLAKLSNRTVGNRDVLIALLDGTVNFEHSRLQHAALADGGGACSIKLQSYAARHGTFVAGLLIGQQDENAFGICPGCSLLVKPIFSESVDRPVVSPGECAEAIHASILSGAKVVNISASYATPSVNESLELRNVLDYALRRDVIVVAAAGNQNRLGSSSLIRHRAVIPVAAVDDEGAILAGSNLGSSIGRRGLAAPGADIRSLDSTGSICEWSGTSAATPFVTGTIALLLSLFPHKDSFVIREALRAAAGSVEMPTARNTVIPPLLNAEASYFILANQ